MRVTDSPKVSPVAALPDRVVFSLTEADRRTIAAALESGSKVCLTGRNPDSPHLKGASHISFPTRDLIATGAAFEREQGIQVGETSAWRVSNLSPSLFGNLVGAHDAFSAMVASFKGRGMNVLLPLESRPEWLPDYPRDVEEWMLVEPDRLTGWYRLEGEELLDKLQGLAARYPLRGLVPLMGKVDSDDVVCIERGAAGLVVIHDYAEPGWETGTTFNSLDEFKSALDARIASVCSDYLGRMIRDPEYIAGIDWGTKRRGHPEGKVLAHIQDLSDNLSAIHSDLTPGQEAQIKIFIHTHDTFKGESVRGVPINHPQSHASLARAFVERYIGETNLSAVIQNHDEFYALWRAEQSTGILDKARYNKLVEAIHDWNLFLTCMIIDGVTPGKDITPVKWSTEIVAADARISLNFSPSDRLNKLLVALQRSP